MAKRFISGAVFVVVMVGFFLLRQFVDTRLFSILIWFLCASTTFEMARAFKTYSNKAVFITQLVYGIVFIPSYYLFRLFLDVKFALLFSVWILIFALTVAVCVTLLTYKGNDVYKRTAINIVPIVYPSVLLFAMLIANAIYGKADLGFIVLLSTFVIPCFSDTSAYLVGTTYQRYRNGKAKKLCPKLSPNKTVAGAIGGIFGGTLGSMIVFSLTMKYSTKWCLIFLALGIIASIATEAGDLLESFIKRKLKIKDMGKIMPGHGGIMDRFDGISLAGAVIFLIIYISVHL